jgi:hypothetical protein
LLLLIEWRVTTDNFVPEQAILVSSYDDRWPIKHYYLILAATLLGCLQACGACWRDAPQQIAIRNTLYTRLIANPVFLRGETKR